MGSHPDFKCTHEDNRKKVCACCGSKIVFGRKTINSFKITTKIKELIREFLDTNFSDLDSRYPLSICTRCRISLRKKKNGTLKRKMPKMPEFDKILVSKETRSFYECNCVICQTARTKCHPNKRFLSNNNRQHQLKICELCLQVLGKGLEHRCAGSRHHKISKNAMNILDRATVSNKQQEQIAVKIIKNKIDQKENTTFRSSKSYKNISVNLSTGGKPAKVTLNPATSKRAIFFSPDHLDNLQTNEGFSDRKMEKITNFIRTSAGKKSIPSNYRQHRQEKSKILLDCYKKDHFEFETSEGKSFRPVIYADAMQLVERIIEERQTEGSNMNFKVVSDGGQNFFKICLSIFPEDFQNFSDEMCSTKYSEGGSAAKKGKLTGVKRIILLCIVPDIKETYENIAKLFQITNLNNISFKFVSDFKLLLIVNGMQTATSSYPCPYCHISLSEMRSYSLSYEKKPRTYGDLQLHFEKFNTHLDSNIKKAKGSFSVINKPLFEEQEDLCVFQKCILPELHLLQGFVNHVFWNGLVPLLGRENALKWPKKLNVIAKNYHGEIFEGNACRKLLKNTNHLASREVLGETDYIYVMPFVSAFNTMNRIVEYCFGSVQTYVGLEADLKHLEAVLKDTGVTQTLKIHCILQHLTETIRYLNTGLGIWSEQAGESIHREFLTIWNKYKINTIDDERYAEQLLKAVVAFSSNRI